MSKNGNEPLRITVQSLSDFDETFIGSFTMASDLPTSKILEELKHGDLTVLSLLCSMIVSDFQRSGSEMNVANWPEPSIVTRLSDFRFTLSHSQLSHISSRFEILARRLVFLRQKLIPTGDFAPRITLRELRQVDFHLALTILELAEIYRTLRS